MRPSETDPKSVGTGPSENAGAEPFATRSTESFATNITGHESHGETSAAISSDRVAEWVAGAKQALADDLPAGHKLWKSWALDLADQVLALARSRHPRLMEDAAMQLALAAEAVDEHIMDNGLAWRRQRLRDEILHVKAMVERHRVERQAARAD